MDYSPSADDVKPETGVKEEVVEKKELESQLDASIQARISSMRNKYVGKLRRRGAERDSCLKFILRPKQDLVKLIFDVKKMTETVIEMQYDANKVDLPRYS